MADRKNASLAEELIRFSSARDHSLVAMKAAASLGTHGTPSWTRGDLHAR